MEVRPRPPILVMGKSEPLHVYEVLSRTGEHPDEATAPAPNRTTMPSLKEGIKPLPAE